MSKCKRNIVIIGGGFGGLSAARKLKNIDACVTLIDRKNYHLFQPLLYQVATGSLSSADISSPLRSILSGQNNSEVILGEVIDIKTESRTVILNDGEIGYDELVLATGSSHHYFGHDEWEALAPGLKTVEDAIAIRRKILIAFEAAERINKSDRIRSLLTFIVVGGGPTGVELAGALAEIARETMKGDFRRIDPSEARIILLEGTDRILGTYPESLSQKARKSLENLGVSIRTGCMVTNIEAGKVFINTGKYDEEIPCETILWAAGVKPSPLNTVISREFNLETDKAGRIPVTDRLHLENDEHVFIIGDMARVLDSKGEPLPGVAPVARQQGAYIAKLLKNRLKGKTIEPFRYRDYGNMATIGRSHAVADLKRIRLSGWFGWIMWLFVHLMYIVEFENRVLVFIQWGWNYVTKGRSNRLILGRDAADNVKVVHHDPDNRT